MRQLVAVVALVSACAAAPYHASPLIGRQCVYGAHVPGGRRGHTVYFKHDPSGREVYFARLGDAVVEDPLALEEVARADRDHGGSIAAVAAGGTGLLAGFVLGLAVSANRPLGDAGGFVWSYAGGLTSLLLGGITAAVLASASVEHQREALRIYNEDLECSR